MGVLDVVHPCHAQVIAQLAARQHGCVTWRQLVDAGVDRGAIAHRLAHSRLHRVHRGVYLVGHGLAPPLARESAAVLACGEGAVLSHLAAATLFGILQHDDPEIDVTVVGCRKQRAGIRVHSVRSLDPRHVTRRRGLPVTAPARTMLDLAEVVSPRELERAMEEAMRMRLVHERIVRDVLARSPGRRGAAVLAALLDAAAGPTFTRSEAEERLLALVREAQLPPPELNVRLGGHEVDFLWRGVGLVVEVDGYAYHSTRASFERDRLRDAALQARGLKVTRVTWRQIVGEPHALVARLARALSRPRQRLSSDEWR
jgi:very-short-patch-repair endonuclease/predicted transcriptional regulator of viral defense system